jgi:small subunit ribosomal protein S19
MRRTITRGLSVEHEKLLEKARDAGEEETANDPIRTHLRDMPIVPEFVGLTFSVYNGQEFQRVEVEPEMIGHYLGEFQLTRNSVEHGQAGIGATRSSKFVPLK